MTLSTNRIYSSLKFTVTSTDVVTGFCVTSAGSKLQDANMRFTVSSTGHRASTHD